MNLYHGTRQVVVGIGVVTVGRAGATLCVTGRVGTRFVLSPLRQLFSLKFMGAQRYGVEKGRVRQHEFCGNDDVLRET